MRNVLLKRNYIEIGNGHTEKVAGKLEKVKDSPKLPKTFIHPTATVATSAKISPGCQIGPHSVIESYTEIGENTIIAAGVYIARDCVIGANTNIRPNATIRENTRIGNNVYIDSGAVIGSDGFGFATCEEGKKHKVPQVGFVEIEDNVTIGANCTVDRATLGRTVIKAGSQVGALAQVAHNVILGKNSVLSPQVGICGSTEIDDGAFIANHVGVAGHIRVGKNAKCNYGSTITKNVPDDADVYGYPAVDKQQDEQIRKTRLQLPELYKKIQDLEKQFHEFLPK